MPAERRLCRPLQPLAIRRHATDVAAFRDRSDVSLLTGHELEFLASLNTRWRRLYRTEFARLLKEHDTRCDGRREPTSIIRISAAPSWRSREDSTNATKA